MKAVSLVEFRKNAGGVLRRIQQGQDLLLTVRGKPLARLGPVETAIPEDDPLYRLSDLAVKGESSLSNREMDRIVYEG